MNARALGGLVALLGMPACATQSPRLSPTPEPAPQVLQDLLEPSLEPPPILPMLPNGDLATEPADIVVAVDPLATGPIFLDPIMTSAAVRSYAIRGSVDWWLQRLMRRSTTFELGLSRMGAYEDFVTAELTQRRLPQSLMYLPLIEADYDAAAMSGAGAAGLWQFMPHTARGLGLRVDAVVDERLEPFKATVAALDYLAYLHERFGSWLLALAAYNAGPSRVAAVMRERGVTGRGDDALFARIRHRLPKETREFVPKFIAAARTAGSPEYYGLSLPVEASPPPPDVVHVEGFLTFSVIAEAAGVDEHAIARLNPHLPLAMTPVDGPTAVRLPHGRGRVLSERLGEIESNERVTVHIIAAGETLARIARRYGVSVDQLRVVNPDVEPRFLRIGAPLLVPVATNAATPLG